MLWNSDFSNLGGGGGDENWFEKSGVKVQCWNEGREMTFGSSYREVQIIKVFFKSGTCILANHNKQADY